MSKREILVFREAQVGDVGKGIERINPQDMAETEPSALG
jgi:hypothetical protein